MFKKIGIILFFTGATLACLPAGRWLAHCLIEGTAFAETLTAEGQPCPPECVTDSMEIVTWYPSPYNEYEELRLYPVQRDDNYCDNDKIGLMYYDDGGTPSFGDDDKMRVCKGTSLSWQTVGGGGGGFTNMRVFDTSDSFEVLSGVTKVMVELWGGGGGGGSTICPMPPAGFADGGCGGGGAYGRGILDVSPGSYSVRVGRGGSGKNGCGENGEDGGESSFGGNLISAGGGKGGMMGTPSSGVSGVGGISTAPENISGQGGVRDLSGGASPKGGIGGYYLWEVLPYVSSPGVAPGGGGVGRMVSTWSSPQYTINASDGAPGRVIVWW